MGNTHTAMARDVTGYIFSYGFWIRESPLVRAGFDLVAGAGFEPAAFRL